eukprot:gb/GEZN01003387.1/.p1 GENE.gb/GEZN01003387.1/~~gb/GEZN01003387.1/.p1  ORF type:complete len:707 (-),score=43.80 gb/GEZN01003387.1/:70-1926(-)
MSNSSYRERPAYQIELSPLLGLTLFFGVILLGIIVALFLQLQSVEFQINSSNRRMMEAIRGTARTSTVYKMSCANLTPRKIIQSGLLANSWDFTTVGMLEQSYRAEGISFGWLTVPESVGFSEEAYAEVMLHKCQTAEKFCFGASASIGSTQNEQADEGPVELPGNSSNSSSHPVTETMLLNRLLYLRGMENSVLPYGVCRDSSNPQIGCDREKLHAALERNPLLFNLISTHAFYEIDAIKRYLEKYQRPLGFSTALLQVNYFSPCKDNKLSEDPVCKECQFPCPEELGGPRECCQRASRANFNMEGEFYTWSVTDKVVGRHAMLLVGFNDHFQTQQGSEGGFLLKNWWPDGVPTGGVNQWELYPTGSHSVAYFQQEISRWDELHVCPNSYNPRNWYVCGDGNSYAGCLEPRVVEFARAVRQPVNLRCVSAEHCNTNPDVVYFAKNTSASGDMLVTLCLWEYHRLAPAETRQLCLWAMVWDDLATVLQPVPEEVVENDPDRCGFYFFPYRLMQNLWTRFSFAMDWEIQWDAVSYVANSASTNGQLDYSLIQKASHIQRSYYFPGPFPIPPYLTGRAQNSSERWVARKALLKDEPLPKTTPAIVLPSRTNTEATESPNV